MIYDHDDDRDLGQVGHLGHSKIAREPMGKGLALAMAEHGVPISASQAWRICKALDLKPLAGRALDDQP